MIAGVYGTSASHNDVGILNLSRLQEYLEEILFPEHIMAGGLYPALYGDAIFQNVNHTTTSASLHTTTMKQLFGMEAKEL
jgi:hypothetical protein